MAFSDAALVQNTIIGLVAPSGTLRKFPLKKYSTNFFPAENLPVDGTAATEITPASVEANELSAIFAQNRKQGRQLDLRMSQWTWQLYLRFDREVDAGSFVEAITKDIKGFDLNGVRAMIVLQRYDASHPTKASGGGSVFTFTFTVLPVE
jgi:hypothetical protein